MTTMTTRVIAQKSNKLNKDILKYVRRHNISYTESTYKAKNNKITKQYILNEKDAIKIIKRFNKNYTSPVKVNVSINNKPKVELTKPVKSTKSNDINTIPKHKEKQYLDIYYKYAINSKEIQNIILKQLFSKTRTLKLSVDNAFTTLIDTIYAFNLHDRISSYSYNLYNITHKNFNNNSASIQSKNYKFFLKSMYWNIIRDKHLQDHPICAICGSTHNLQIHHPDYKLVPRGTEYLHMNLLTTLCNNCHATYHKK